MNQRVRMNGMRFPCLAILPMLAFAASGLLQSPRVSVVQARETSADVTPPVTEQPAPAAGSDRDGWRLARQHLPELLPVLEYLREHEPERYERAMRELDRSAKRLEVQAKRGPAFLDNALRQWQVRGQIDLIRARLKVSPSDAGRRRLQAALRKQKEIEWERLQLDRTALVERESAIRQRLVQTTQLAERVRRQREELDRAIELLGAERPDLKMPDSSAGNTTEPATGRIPSSENSTRITPSRSSS
ncbi:MAG: hypothetical protein EA381_09570 [Planctomycetaceae bacterium]|nr:MAG: hypothetical protein EA381_09570 [Planctomycetaceae bacterium]